MYALVHALPLLSETSLLYGLNIGWRKKTLHCNLLEKMATLNAFVILLFSLDKKKTFWCQWLICFFVIVIDFQ